MLRIFLFNKSYLSIIIVSIVFATTSFSVFAADSPIVSTDASTDLVMRHNARIEQHIKDANIFRTSEQSAR